MFKALVVAAGIVFSAVNGVLAIDLQPASLPVPLTMVPSPLLAAISVDFTSEYGARVPYEFKEDGKAAPIVELDGVAGSLGASASSTGTASSESSDLASSSSASSSSPGSASSSGLGDLASSSSAGGVSTPLIYAGNAVNYTQPVADATYACVQHANALFLNGTMPHSISAVDIRNTCYIPATNSSVSASQAQDAANCLAASANYFGDTRIRGQAALDGTLDVLRKSLPPEEFAIVAAQLQPQARPLPFSSGSSDGGSYDGRGYDSSSSNSRQGSSSQGSDPGTASADFSASDSSDPSSSSHSSDPGSEGSSSDSSSSSHRSGSSSSSHRSDSSSFYVPAGSYSTGPIGPYYYNGVYLPYYYSWNVGFVYYFYPTYLYGWPWWIYLGNSAARAPTHVTYTIEQQSAACRCRMSSDLPNCAVQVSAAHSRARPLGVFGYVGQMVRWAFGD
jgi:hypothetical protein